MCWLFTSNMPTKEKLILENDADDTKLVEDVVTSMVNDEINAVDEVIETINDEINVVDNEVIEANMNHDDEREDAMMKRNA